MKYLKKFNESKSREEQIELLEDCLQEIFDKYHIQKIDIGDVPPMTTPTYKILLNNFVNIPKIDIFVDYPSLDSITHIENHKLFYDLLNIKKSIEKRLGRELDIETFPSSSTTFLPARYEDGKWIKGITISIFHNSYL